MSLTTRILSAVRDSGRSAAESITGTTALRMAERVVFFSVTARRSPR